MHFAEILGLESKQKSNKNFNEIAPTFRLPSKPSAENLCFFSVYDFDGSQNIRAILLKFLSFCCFDFDPKIQQNAFIRFIIYFIFIYIVVWSKILVVLKKVSLLLEIDIYPYGMMSFP